MKENDMRTGGEEIKRSFYMDILVGKIIGTFVRRYQDVYDFRKIICRENPR
jgi:hypothetical protein